MAQGPKGFPDEAGDPEGVRVSALQLAPGGSSAIAFLVQCGSPHPAAYTLFTGA